jgi:hypothetical protein
MKFQNTGLFLRHPVGQWRTFSNGTSRALGGELVITHVWQRRAAAATSQNHSPCKDKS